MRKAGIILCGLVILLLVNYSIYSREQLLDNGKTVLLELAPVDPRSLMQGDYMALRFTVARKARAAIQQAKDADGLVVLALDSQGVGRFSGLDKGETLQGNELVMRYRQRANTIKFATNAFFFQEGKAELYEAAKYGEFKVSASGDSILVAMRDASFAQIGDSLLSK